MFVCPPSRPFALRCISALADGSRRLRLFMGVAAASAVTSHAAAQGPYNVTTTADAGPGSLRQAISDANAGTGGMIRFSIPTTDPGFNLPGTPAAWRIALASPLPALQRAIMLDALTQPDASCGSPRIELRPAGATVPTGVMVSANGCEIRGLVVNGFTAEGIAIQSATGCTVACNFIGTDVTGANLLGNGVGISILNGSNNTIGGLAAGTSNLIAGNLGVGVSVTTTGQPSNVGNAILRNSIRSNGALGIDLGANGVTPNDDLDLDTGPNHYQNYPIVTGYDGATVTASLSSLPNRRFRIEFFANTSQDPSGFGEGSEFIGGIEVLSNNGGQASASVPYTASPGVRFITATATSLPPLRSSQPGEGGGIEPRGIAPAAPIGTSEFSAAFRVGPGGGNQPPIARDDAYATNEDVPLAIGAPLSGVLANDNDPEASPLTAALVTDALHGALVLNTNGTFSYIPDANYNGTDTFTYRASDGEDPSNIATVVLTVRPVNDSPFAVNDEYSTDEDTPLTVPTRALGVLANDIDAEYDVLSAIRLTNPLHGALTLNPDGTLTYTPAANYFGDDSFTYKANDGQLDSGPATVAITVLAVNDPPTAADDSYTTGFDTPLVISSAGSGVLSNDSDPENDPLIALQVTPPAGGSTTLNANGTFTYTPSSGFSGTDSFTYRARDAAADSSPATVRITVRGNQPPVATGEMYSTNEDTPLTVSSVAMGVLANDTDPDVPPQTLTAILVTTTMNGSLTFSPNGTFNYNPQPNFNGADSFTYRVSDGVATSGVVTASITVLPINDPPVAVADSYFTNEDTVLNVPPLGVLLNDSDVDNDRSTLTVTITTPPVSGALSNVAGGGFRYTPNADFSGTDTFRYRAADPAGAQSNIVTVTISVLALNDPPVAADDSYTTDEDTPLTVPPRGVLINDTDPDSPLASLTAQVVTPPPPVATAAFTFNADGSFLFTPAADFSGPVTFTYAASDGAAASNTATVTITVRPINDPPVALNDDYAVTFDTPLTVAAPQGVLRNDSDFDGPQPLTAAAASSTAHGALVFNPDGSFAYTPQTGYSGPDSFTYRATDGLLSSNLATVSLTVSAGGNQPPIARCRDVTIDARSTCPPPEAFFISAETVNNGSSDPDDPAEKLVLSVSNTGPFRLGATSVTLTVTDPHGASSTCTATITVLGDDCNRNGTPDSCDIASGGAADCNRDGVPDDCQCLWDNGMAAGAGSGGRLSQIGGRNQVVSKVADDFYLEPGSLYRITTFSGQVFTNLAPALRNARVEFLNDCNGRPDGSSIGTFVSAAVAAEEPGEDGYTLVTYTFDLCSANLWLDGGKTYWVSLTSTVPCGNGSESFWAFGSPEVLCSIPRVANGRPSPYLCTDVRFDPWLPLSNTGNGCKNMAFKLGGASCPIIWDNGPYQHCPGGGGIPSGPDGGHTARAADNFVVKPCDDQTVCVIEATIWTNGDPATGFVEIYGNDCKRPESRLFDATVTRVVDLHETIRIGRIDVHAYLLQFYDLNWRLPAGRTYWISAGAFCTGPTSLQRAYFALADTCGTHCDVRISPAWMGVVGATGTLWCPKAGDLSFRIAATPGIRHPSALAATPPRPSCQTDVNGDGAATIDDFLAFLAAWFAGCP